MTDRPSQSEDRVEVAELDAAPRWSLAILTVCGLGFIRPGPGTWGSLPPVTIAFGMATFGAAATIDITLVALAVMASAACVIFTEVGERHFGRKDASQIVADEVAGQAVALLLLPWRGPGEANAIGWNLTLAATAFIAFRVLDISKPPPIRQLQNIRGGWGVLLDDLLAGCFALAIAQVLARLVL